MIDREILNIYSDNGDVMLLIAPSEPYDLKELAKDFEKREGETVHNENIRFKDFLLANGFEELKITSYRNPLDD